MYIVMNPTETKVQKQNRNVYSVEFIDDEKSKLKLFYDDAKVKLDIGEFKQEIEIIELMECVQEAYESGHFYIDAIEEYIFGIEQDRDQLLIENQQLRRELEHGRSVLLNR